LLLQHLDNKPNHNLANIPNHPLWVAVLHRLELLEFPLVVLDLALVAQVVNLAGILSIPNAEVVGSGRKQA
jgi:hypothetical protein